MCEPYSEYTFIHTPLHRTCIFTIILFLITSQTLQMIPDWRTRTINDGVGATDHTTHTRVAPPNSSARCCLLDCATYRTDAMSLVRGLMTHISFSSSSLPSVDSSSRHMSTDKSMTSRCNNVHATAVTTNVSHDFQELTCANSRSVCVCTNM